jgi:hypothetical protein
MLENTVLKAFLFFSFRIFWENAVLGRFSTFQKNIKNQQGVLIKNHDKDRMVFTAFSTSGRVKV